jgi:hypothetical protein
MRLGRIKAAIWANSTDNGVRHNVTFTRLYRDDQNKQWKDSQSFGRAMQERLGSDAEETFKSLLQNGIPRGLAFEALEFAKQQGRFTIFSLVDALTRATQKCHFAGERAEADARGSSLLALAA